MPGKKDNRQVKIDELTADLQRLRADFENYRKRTDTEKTQVADSAKTATILKLLPVVDTVERAILHVPGELANNQWAQGVVSLGKNLEKSLGEMGVTKIDATVGAPFDPNVHEAVSMEDEGGNHEIIAEELRAGYRLGSQVIRPSMVKVKR